MKPQVKKKATELRKRGWSYAEICKELRISKSTAWHWKLYDIPLTKNAKIRLLNRSIQGNRRGIISRQRKIIKQEGIVARSLIASVSRLPRNIDLARFACALLYWCEGAKDRFTVKFTNSDPELIKTFLVFLRRGFEIDEKKLRVLVHLHEYHNPQKQKKFWSKITRVPAHQFFRSYIKPHTGKVKRDKYPGCITIYYSDRWLVFALKNIRTQIAKIMGV